MKIEIPIELLFDLPLDKIKVDSPNGFIGILDVFEKGHKQTIKVSTLLHSITVSEDHRILTPNNIWVNAKNLKINDLICTHNGIEQIIDLEYCGSQRVIDIEVDHSDHSYYSDGIVSHNSGKTMTSLSAIAYSLEFNTISRAVFVLEPKNAKQTVNEVIHKFNGIPTLNVVGRSPKSRRELYSQFVTNPNHRILVVNYELLKNDIEYIAKIFRDHKVCLVADEITKVKNKDTKMHKIINRLSSMSHRVVGLSATPIYNKLGDMHTIMQCLGINVVSDAVFYNQHCEWEVKRFGSRKIRSIKAYKNISGYMQKISPYFFSKKKSEIVDVTFAYSKRDFELGDQEKKALRILGDTDSIARIAIAISCPSLITEEDEDTLSVKEQDLIDYIDNELDNKMMVYSPFKTVIKRLEKLLNDRYGKDFAVAIHGDVKDPEPAKHMIINNPKTRIILGTSSIEKGMDGMQKVVDTEYFFTLPISAGAYLQLLGRTSRDGGIFDMVTVVIPFIGDQFLDFQLYILIQNQLALLNQTTPDALEKGCIDLDMIEHLPKENVEDPNQWLRSKINIH